MSSRSTTTELLKVSRLYINVRRGASGFDR